MLSSITSLIGTCKERFRSEKSELGTELAGFAQGAQGVALRFVVVPETLQPLNAELLSEPCHLAFGVAASFELSGLDGLVLAKASLHNLERLLVAEGLERFSFGRHSAGKNAAHLF